MANYSRNSAWKFGRKIQNHWDNNALCAVGSFILPHPVESSIHSAIRCEIVHSNLLTFLGATQESHKNG